MHDDIELPDNPHECLAVLVSRCAGGFAKEMIEAGYTATEARNMVVHHFVAFACGEACRIAREEGREPDPDKWRKATDIAFENAVERTAP